jgi:hypothetical protein
MVNNFDIVRHFLDFSNPDTYYFLQILKRRKDNPDLEKDMIVISDIFIYSLEQFNRMESEIIETCKINNARAYFRLNKRSLKKSALQMLKKVTSLVIDENYKAVKNAYSSVSGEFSADPDKKWIVDIDEKDEQLDREIQEYINTLQPEGMKIYANIPTKNGNHLITKPFRVDEFKKKYPQVDIHKDNPTILFIP